MTRKDAPLWQWNGLIVRANTKSEARGRLKKLTGLRRLPIGARVFRFSVAAPIEDVSAALKVWQYGRGLQPAG